jgi:gluconolactonase
MPPRECASDIAEGEVENFGEPTPTRTEGITFGFDGTLYVSALVMDDPDQLLDVSLDGSSSVAAESESILGLATDTRGILAAAIDTGEVLLIDQSDGSVDVITDELTAPNALVVTAWDTILVSDDSPGTDSIYEVTFDGEVSTWVTGVPTPNGLVFSLDGSFLYVATTFEEEGLWRVPVDSEGNAGTPERWVVFEEVTFPDGVAIDSEGNVYVALNGAGRIEKVDREGNATTLVDGIGGVASLAFGKGDFDPCSIYATNLFGTQLWRAGAGVLGPE